MYIDLLLIDEVHIKLTVLLLIIIMIASVSIVLKGNVNAVFPSLPMRRGILFFVSRQSMQGEISRQRNQTPKLIST
jgi:hypothetical protein